MVQIHIKEIVKLHQFFIQVQKCKGDVELVTGEGDRLNLKSTLCQYIALTQMFSEGKMEKMVIELSNDQDEEGLRPFLVKA